MKAAKSLPPVQKKRIPMGGVYAIRNIETRKIYIGKTGGFRERWRTHLSQLKKGGHCNTSLRNESLVLTLSAFL